VARGILRIEIFSANLRRENPPSIAHGVGAPGGLWRNGHFEALQPPLPSVNLACQSGPPALLRSSRSHAACRSTALDLDSCVDPIAWPKVSISTGTTRGGFHPNMDESSRFFHNVSTGEPALAVQAVHLRRSPRQPTSGAWGLRFPREQGTGLHQFIHRVSLPRVEMSMHWPPGIPRFSPKTTGWQRLASPHHRAPQPWAYPVQDRPRQRCSKPSLVSFSTGSEPRS
jgi:hypothetical protein